MLPLYRFCVRTGRWYCRTFNASPALHAAAAAVAAIRPPVPAAAAADPKCDASVSTAASGGPGAGGEDAAMERCLASARDIYTAAPALLALACAVGPKDDAAVMPPQVAEAVAAAALRAREHSGPPLTGLWRLPPLPDSTPYQEWWVDGSVGETRLREEAVRGGASEERDAAAVRVLGAMSVHAVAFA